MSPANLNLAEDPFLNRRPVQRLRMALWILGLVLLAVNVNLYMENRVKTTEERSRLRALEDEIERESEAIVELQDTLRELGPQEQNSAVVFLNQRIGERTFPWGELFDTLGEVLPAAVRLRSLNPKVGGQSPSRGVPEVRDETQDLVGLSITGIAKTDEALYQLVDAFFAHPRFERPKLSYERSQGAGNLSFALNVDYLPAVSSLPENDAAVDPETEAES